MHETLYVLNMMAAFMCAFVAVICVVLNRPVRFFIYATICLLNAKAAGLF